MKQTGNHFRSRRLPRLPHCRARAALLRGLAMAVLAGVTAVLGLGWTESLPPHPVTGPAPLWAQESEDVDENAERDRRKQLLEDAAAKRKKAEELKGKESKELKNLRSTERKQRRTRKQLSRLQRRERRLDRDLDTVRSELSDARETLETRRLRLARRLRNLYKMGRLRQIESLLGADSFARFFARIDYLERIADQDRRLLLAIQSEKERITRAEGELDQTLTRVQSNARKKRSERNRLSRLTKKKKTLVASIKSEREAYEAAAEELEQTARRIQQLLARLEARRRGEDLLPEYHGNFSAGRAQLPWPVRGRVVGRFGNQKHPKWGTTTFNSGIDIAAALGTSVRAVAKGRVDFVNADYGSYGQLVILNHGEGYYTLYAHCSAILVSRGEEVESGTVIARVGDSGSLKGSVLHFEIRNGRKAQNPEHWLR